MPAYGVRGARRTVGGRGNVIARLAARLAGAFNVGLDLDQAAHVRQPQFAGKATIARQPIDRADDADRAPLDAARAFVMLDMAFDCRRRGIC
jgi:hypothetical protein